MVKTFDEIAEQVTNIADKVGYMKRNIQRHQESETGGTMVIKNEYYDIMLDIGDNQEYYRLATYRVTSEDIEREEKNVTEVKSLRGIKGYLIRFDK